MNSLSRHTPNRARLGSAANATFHIKYISWSIWLKHLGIWRVQTSLLSTFDNNILCFVSFQTPSKAQCSTCMSDGVSQTVIESWPVVLPTTAAAMWESHYALRWQQQLFSSITPNISFVFIPSIHTLISLAREEDVSVSGDHWNSNNSAQCVLVCEL